MAGNEDKDSRTEEPTEKRISDAVAKGNVPFAREVALAGSIASTLAAVVLLGAWASASLLGVLRAMLEGAGGVALTDREAAASYLGPLLVGAGGVLLAVMLVIAAGTVIASVIQNGAPVSLERITPKLDRISMTAGFGRLFGRQGMIEFAKSAAKLVCISAVTFITLKSSLDAMTGSLLLEPSALPGLILTLTARILIALTIASLVLAVADLALSRINWRRGLRMTRQEIKEEVKESEGDLQLKARIRDIARRRSSRRMLDRMPRATMVIANPTHYAVALRYAKDEAGAPTVLAKGVDHMALKIRELAAAHNVPVVEDRPLARALHDKVEIDQEIPPEFYRAVAEIIHFLNTRRRLPVARPQEPARPGQA